MHRVFLLVFLLSGVTPRGDMAQRRPEPEAEPENTPEPHAPKTWEDVKFERFDRDGFHPFEAWTLALDESFRSTTTRSSSTNAAATHAPQSKSSSSPRHQRPQGRKRQTPKT